jgi:hypothetical protein
VKKTRVKKKSGNEGKEQSGNECKGVKMQSGGKEGRTARREKAERQRG